MNLTAKGIAYGMLAAIAAVAAMWLVDILMVWSLYRWFFQTLSEETRLPDTLNGALSVWLTLVTLLLMPTALYVLLIRRSPVKMAVVALAISGWFVVLYFLGLPKQGEYFNPITGQARYMYHKAENGQIETFPLGYQYHPLLGVSLSVLTPNIAKDLHTPLPQPTPVPVPQWRRNKAHGILDYAAWKCPDRSVPEKKYFGLFVDPNENEETTEPVQSKEPCTSFNLTVRDVLNEGLESSIVVSLHVPRTLAEMKFCKCDFEDNTYVRASSGKRYTLMRLEADDFVFKDLIDCPCTQLSAGEDFQYKLVFYAFDSSSTFQLFHAKFSSITLNRSITQ